MVQSERFDIDAIACVAGLLEPGKEGDMHMQTCCPTRSLEHPELELGDEETMNKILEPVDSLLTQRDLSLDDPTNGIASKLLTCSTLQEMCCEFLLSHEMWYRKSVLPGTGAG